MIGMRSARINRGIRLSTLANIGALLASQAGAAQFVELTAKIETVRWSDGYKDKAPSVQTRNWTTRCVVGTNGWLIEQDSGETSRDAWWFTGSNIIAHTALLKYPSERVELFERNHPEMAVGRGYTRVLESQHGEPAPVGALTAGLEPTGTAFVHIPWLAFCSGPYLKSNGRWIPQPSIEYLTYGTRYSDRTTSFQDTLGLPSEMEFYTTNNQPVCQYRIVGSTNVLGWNFPLEFHLAQYRRDYQTGVCQLHMTATGKLTSIGVGGEPGVPTAAQKALEK
jgi:hypothetical protein